MNPVSPSRIQGRADIEIGSSIEEQRVHGRLFKSDPIILGLSKFSLRTDLRREFPDYLDLKILAWLGDLNTVVLRKALKKMNTPMQQPIPGFPLLIFKRCIVERPPFPMKHRATIVFAKISPKCFFKAAAEDHCGLCFFLAPAVQVAMTLAARTA